MRAFTPGFVFGELMYAFGLVCCFFLFFGWLVGLAWVMWPVMSRNRNRIEMSGVLTWCTIQKLPL